MYVITFYSFKGGVGRTLALVNVAIELARTGKRVFLIDFDLEAPGIDTFPELASAEPKAGVVEFVSTYAATRESPDVRNYAYEAKRFASGGCIWVMPAGKGDEAYGQRLASINWQRLYLEEDGFLLMEDLREQIAEQYAPHYVLVDSRTGHTDVAGICTRQLPDAVVFLFVPSPQNLAGLRKIVSDVRAESHGERRKDINLHFVMSNVPNIDDEDRILETQCASFRRALKYRRLTATIHHYPSLSLLDQSIFALTRPKSRLSREYRELKDRLVERNLQDRDVAIKLLSRRAYGWVGREESPTAVEVANWSHTIDEIESLHNTDGEVLFQLGRVHRSQGRTDLALELLNRAEAHRFKNSKLLAMRAELRQLTGDTGGAAQDSTELLDMERADASDILQAIAILRRTTPDLLRDVADRNALATLPADDAVQLANGLQWTRLGQRASAQVLERVLRRTDLNPEMRRSCQKDLLLSLIGLARFAEACEVAHVLTDSQSHQEVDVAFNAAIANWGRTKQPDPHLFSRIIEMDAGDEGRSEDENYLQCLSICFAVTGEKQKAIQRVTEAEDLARREQSSAFSCWRYLKTNAREFVRDCRELRRFIEGEAVVPTFLQTLPDSLFDEHNPDKSNE